MSPNSNLMERATDFVAVEMPHASRLVLHVMAAFAEHEREMISQRTKAALAAAKARGVKLGLNGARIAARIIARPSPMPPPLRITSMPRAHRARRR